MKVPEPAEGLKKEAVKHYFYINEGLTFCNSFRYLIMSILAIYAILKMENPWLMPLMFFVSLPVLDVLGWMNVNHVKKIIDYFRIKRATTYGKYGYELQEQQLKVLLEIKSVLDKGE